MSDNILQVRNLKTYFFEPSGIVKAVDGVSFDVKRSTVFGLVGESGSGKTLTALSILRLVFPPGKIIDGGVVFDDENLLKLDEDRLRGIRGSGISIVFQEPAGALNPVFTVGSQIAESVLVHQKVNKTDAKDISMEFFKKVRISDPERIYRAYPHQLSGGTKQRAMIAMALVNSPELVILDEPTTALDVTIQSQVLDLLEEVIERDNTSAIFISHDFGIISRMCDRVAVMHKGKIVEEGSKDQILNNPKDPYTISLLDSVKALS